MSDRSDPFEDVENLFDQLAELGIGTSGEIPVDVKDEDDAFVVVADLPGYDTDDIDVHLEDEYSLSITATREHSETVEEESYVRQERHTERVGRTVPLPEAVDGSSTDASHENGVLTVRLGKEEIGDDGTDIPVN